MHAPERVPEHFVWNSAPPCLLALLAANVLSARVAFPHCSRYTAPPFSAWFSVNVLVIIWTVDAFLAAIAPPAEACVVRNASRPQQALRSVLRHLWLAVPHTS